HNRLLNYVLGNWQLNGIYLARSGMPYDVYVGRRCGQYRQCVRSANLVGDPHLDHPDREKWFNTSAFEIPALYTFGNLGGNRLRSAAYWNMHTSVVRNSH